MKVVTNWKPVGQRRGDGGGLNSFASQAAPSGERANDRPSGFEGRGRRQRSDRARTPADPTGCGRLSHLRRSQRPAVRDTLKVVAPPPWSSIQVCLRLTATKFCRRWRDAVKSPSSLTCLW